MTQATVSRVRRTTRVFAFVAPFLALLVLAGACGQQKRAEGDDCLKDEDCLSGYCVQLHCGSAPPLTDAEVTGDVSVTEAASDAASSDGAADATPGNDAQTGGGMDAPADSPGPDDTGTGGGG